MNNGDDWGLGARPDEDLEYDLAHDAVTGAPHADSAERAPRSDDEEDGAGLTYVATETPDYAGDYSYDLSHDVPGR